MLAPAVLSLCGCVFNAAGLEKAPDLARVDAVLDVTVSREGMLDGSDAVADWPMLNALLNCAAGADSVHIHNGGGVGIGLSTHAGMVVVADGTPAAAERIERVFTTDPGIGVVRHADAGYMEAKRMARRGRIRMPMLR